MLLHLLVARRFSRPPNVYVILIGHAAQRGEAGSGCPARPEAKYNVTGAYNRDRTPDWCSGKGARPDSALPGLCVSRRPISANWPIIYRETDLPLRPDSINDSKNMGLECLDDLVDGASRAVETSIVCD